MIYPILQKNPSPFNAYTRGTQRKKKEENRKKAVARLFKESQEKHAKENLKGTVERPREKGGQLTKGTKKMQKGEGIEAKPPGDMASTSLPMLI